jgi:hypothetical protein
MARLKTGTIKHLTVLVTNKGPSRKKEIELARSVIPSSYIKNKDFARHLGHPATHEIMIKISTKKTCRQGELTDLMSKIKDWIHKLETKNV